MIDEPIDKTLDILLPRVGEVDGMTEELRTEVLTKALTAIYEIGLEVIGQDEPMATAEFGLDPEEVYMPTDTIRDIRNDLRASQRKAWAKACGVAEK